MMQFRRKKVKPARGRQRPQRTATGAPAAFSYYGQRSATSQTTTGGREPGRAEAAKKASSKVYVSLTERAALLLLLIAIIAGTINAVSLSTVPHILPLGSNSSAFLHSSATYQSAASSILGSSVWNRNKLTINTAAVSQQLQQRFPELANVSIALPLLAHRPVIYIQPSQPVLILNTASGGYVIGQNGVALLASTELPVDSKLDLLIANDQTGVHIKKGQQAFSGNDIAFIQTVLAQLKAANISVDNLTLPPAASELDVRLKGQPYYAKFNMHASLDDARQQAGTFIAVYHRLASQNITPRQYIDVRVDGRAYYQ